MPRLIRRRPLWERIKAYLNPLDFLLWLSEEVESSDWDQKNFATWLGLGLNLAFMIARANSGRSGLDRGRKDIFGDGPSGSGWISWFASFVVHVLTAISVSNAAYTFFRRRQYRLFEASVDMPPGTPSAHRVRVDSSPMSSSPLRFLTTMITSSTAESRSHPDATRDVWELAVWDPTPMNLRLFCLFSPGHVLVYWLFLPTFPSDPRPSVIVIRTMFLSALLSIQLLLLQSNFSQQSKDTAVIHREVLNEYDTKYVHPRLNPVVRDVATQFDASDMNSSENVAQTYTPTTIINKGFRTNPNPNYAKHIDVDNTGAVPSRSIAFTPGPSAFQTPNQYRRESSPFRRAIRQPQFRGSTGPSTTLGDGGSLGIYSHASSPLKKTASSTSQGSTFNDRIRGDSPAKRESSPLKRTTMSSGNVPGQVSSHGFSGTINTPRRESGYF